jgi:hypothetical protein
MRPDVSVRAVDDLASLFPDGSAATTTRETWADLLAGGVDQVIRSAASSWLREPIPSLR